MGEARIGSGKHSSRTPRVLLVEDDADYAGLLTEGLREQLCGVTIERVGSVAAAVRFLESAPVAALLLDASLPDGDALTLVVGLRRAGAQVPFLVLTADASAQTAVRALHEGAHDYVVKGQGAIAHAAAGLRLLLADGGAAARSENLGMVGSSQPMCSLRRSIELYGPSDAPVLIEGETGVGKELVARALHVRSRRATGPFVAVNCSSFPEALAEAEFFGHVRGAYTGAAGDRGGLVQHAGGGTLFLDEVEDLPLAIQGKLLRLLQEGDYRPVGSSRTRKSDIRIVAASNRSLRRMVGERAFRADLYYRLYVLALRVAPLRDRLDDLPSLLAHLLGPGTGPDAMPSVSELARLEQYEWPGNVRELQNCVERARVVAQASDWRFGWNCALADLTSATWVVCPTVSTDLESARSGWPKPGPAPVAGAWSSRRETTRSTADSAVRGAPNRSQEEYASLRQMLDQHHWVRSATARALGISRATLWRRMRRHGLLGPASD